MVPVERWETESFPVVVRRTPEPWALREADWDSIEAIGAADDPTRFIIEYAPPETTPPGSNNRL